MAQYKCTNIGNCTKANNAEIITASGIEPRCPECKSILSFYTERPSFWERWGKTCIGIVAATVMAIIAYFIFCCPEENYSVAITAPSAEQGKVIGSVSGKDKKIDCGSICTQEYSAKTPLKLIAQPNKGFLFSSWTGDCEKTRASECTLPMDSDKKVGVIFKYDKSPKTATINIQLYGEGVVKSDDGKINCISAICKQEYPKDTEIVLTAIAKEGHQIRQWGEACEQAENNQCTIKLDTNKNAIVFFEKIDDGGDGIPPCVNHNLKKAMEKCTEPPDENCIDEMIKAIDSCS